MDTCDVCAHYRGIAVFKDLNDPTVEGDHRNFCDAFPNGIPDEIIYGDIDHKSPYTGDHGIVFEKSKHKTP
jgi:hypothetical protein